MVGSVPNHVAFYNSNKSPFLSALKKSWKALNELIVYSSNKQTIGCFEGFFPSFCEI